MAEKNKKKAEFERVPVKRKDWPAGSFRLDNFKILSEDEKFNVYLHELNNGREVKFFGGRAYALPVGELPWRDPLVGSKKVPLLDDEASKEILNKRIEQVKRFGSGVKNVATGLVDEIGSRAEAATHFAMNPHLYKDDDLAATVGENALFLSPFGARGFLGPSSFGLAREVIGAVPNVVEEVDGVQNPQDAKAEETMRLRMQGII